MAADNIAICNIALTMIGASTITSFTQDPATAESRACSTVYNDILNEVLEAYPWTFAQKRVALVDSGVDPVWTDDGVTVKYIKPTDLLKVNFTNIESALVKIEGVFILSDTDELQIKYTFLQTTTTAYSGAFTTALATRLAAALAFHITSSRSLEAQKILEYEEKRLPKAQSIDSQQGTPLPPMQDNILVSRIQGGSGAISGRSGWDTWFPCGC